MIVTQPVLIFLESCALGFLLGAFYDVFRILRLSFPHPKVLVFVEDVLYFFLITVFSFIFVLMQNNGILRAFLLLGLLLGAILYFFTLSILIMKAAQLIIRIVKSFLKFLYRITLKPIFHLFLAIWRKIRKLGHFFKERYKIIHIKYKKHLKQKDEIVYNDPNQTNNSSNSSPKRAEWTLKRKWLRKKARK